MGTSAVDVSEIIQELGKDDYASLSDTANS